MTNKIEYTSWEETKIGAVDGGAALAVAAVGFDYEGDLAGTGTIRFTLVYLPDGTGTFTGAELFTGKIGGRSGTVAFRHEGTFRDDTVFDTWTVIPGSGTGDLAEARGEVTNAAGFGEAGVAYKFTPA